MWRLWQLFDPRRVIVALFIFLFGLALTIHFLLLGTSRFNWIDGPKAEAPGVAVAAPEAATPATPVAVPAAPAKIVDKYVLFDTDKSDIRASAQKYIDEAVTELKAVPSAKAELYGTTDSTGSADHNKALSASRNAAVQAALVAAGIDASRITTAAEGESAPKADNATDQGMQRNRSVDIHITEDAPAAAPS
jgi:outer membrane protein OmpA-like peptidoglycan-associated protein